MSYVIWDVETTTLKSYKRKANPFDTNNFVVASGFKRKGGEIVGEYYGRNEKSYDWFTKLLHGTDLLVGFNIKFDLQYALKDPQNYEAWQEYVARGGNVWDCQLAEYLLKGMEPRQHMLALDEVALRYGGNTKIDEVKALWQAGVDTADINEDLLMRYLTGGEDVDGTFQEGDIGNTERVFLGQIEKAKAAGQSRSILLNMGSLLCTLEMEKNGMKIDKDRGLVLANELSLQLKSLTESLGASLPTDLPFEFNWNSRTQLSALIFGGTVKYKKRMAILDEATGEEQYYTKDEEHVQLEHTSNFGTFIAKEAYDAQLHGPVVRFKSGKNAGEIKTKRVKVRDESRGIKERWEDFTYTFPQMTEPNDKWKTATSGVYQTGSEVLKSLEGRGITFLTELAKASTIRKDLGTYYITTDEDTGEQKGMLTLVQDDGIIHGQLNHTNTVTGRFSSSNPNLQNISNEGKSEVKTIFVSRFKDGSIVQSDFKSLEVYVQAILSLDSQMITDLKAGLDMHSVRVSQTAGVSYDEVIRLVKVIKDEVWINKRSKAKNFSFQRAYGAGAKAISEATGIPLEEVEKLIEVEEARYPGVVKFNDAVMAEVKRSRKPTSQFIPHPDVPGLMVQPGIGWYRTPDRKLYTFREHPAPAWMIKHGKGNTSFSPPDIKNYAVQGTGGEWAKAAMWICVRAFYALREQFKGRALLVNQVHDAVYLDAAEDVREHAAAVLHASMEAASDFIEYYFKWNVPVPVPTETVSGPNMMTADEITSDTFKQHVQQTRTYLRSTFMNNYVPSFVTN